MTSKFKFFCTALVCGCMQVGSVFAADLIIQDQDPVPFAPDEVIPVVGFDWNRFYGGIYAGYGIGDVDITNNLPDPDHSAFYSVNGADISGVVGGITLGKNFQFNDNFVFGLEGDIGLANMKTSDSTQSPEELAYSAEIDYIASLRGRVGALLGEQKRTMAYFTAGYAFAHVNTSVTQRETGFLPSTDSHWLDGLTIGGGAEVALKENITFKAEYLYTKLQGDFSVPVGTAGNANFNVESEHQIRAGVNFHF